MTLAIVMLLAGFVLLVFAADYLVKGAANIAAAIGISPLVIGLTVVAFGTSAPELAVSVASAFKGEADLAVGNVIGSNVFNILVILGISAMIIPLVVHRQLVRFDLPVMIGFSVILYGLSFDRMISRWDGMILFGLGVVYVAWLIRASKQSGKADVSPETAELLSDDPDPKWAKNLLLIALGIAGLTGGSHFLVQGAVYIAGYFGVSELIIGLTIISVGTSLPEVATSVMAALKGERDIAVGNVVGSNIFNIMSVLGISSIVAPAGIAVPEAAIRFDMVFMVAIAIAAFPVFHHGYRVGRISGFVFFGFYLAYLVYLILDATGHEIFPQYREAIIYWLVPATILLLAIIEIMALRGRKNHA